MSEKFHIELFVRSFGDRKMMMILMKLLTKLTRTVRWSSGRTFHCWITVSSSSKLTTSSAAAAVGALVNDDDG